MQKSNVVALAKSKDIKKAILDALGDLDGYEVLGSNVLCATYVRPEKTAGGLYLPEKSHDENRYQGKVALVLKMGAAAFKYDGAFEFEGQKPQVGDWVMHHAMDARELFIKGTSVKLIDSSLIRMIVPDPVAVY